MRSGWRYDHAVSCSNEGFVLRLIEYRYLGSHANIEQLVTPKDVSNKIQSGRYLGFIYTNSFEKARGLFGGFNIQPFQIQIHLTCLF